MMGNRASSRLMAGFNKSAQQAGGTHYRGVNLATVPNMKCICGSECFKYDMHLKRLSPILTGNPGVTHAVVQGRFRCERCGMLVTDIEAGKTLDRDDIEAADEDDGGAGQITQD